MSYLHINVFILVTISSCLWIRRYTCRVSIVPFSRIDALFYRDIKLSIDFWGHQITPAWPASKPFHVAIGIHHLRAQQIRCYLTGRNKRMLIKPLSFGGGPFCRHLAKPNLCFLVAAASNKKKHTHLKKYERWRRNLVFFYSGIRFHCFFFTNNSDCFIIFFPTSHTHTRTYSCLSLPFLIPFIFVTETTQTPLRRLSFSSSCGFCLNFFLDVPHFFNFIWFSSFVCKARKVFVEF